MLSGSLGLEVLRTLSLWATIQLSDGLPTSDLAEEYEKFQPATDQVGSMSTTVQV